MIPMGNFMQALSGSLPGSGDNAVTIEKKGGGPHNSKDAAILPNDDAGSFLRWMRQLMDTGGIAEPDGDNSLDLDSHDLNPDLTGQDALATLNTKTETMDPPAMEMPVVLADSGLNEQDPNMVSVETEAPEIGHGEPIHMAGNRSMPLMAAVQEMKPAVDNDVAGRQLPSAAAQQVNQTDISNQSPAPQGEPVFKAGDDSQVEAKPFVMDGKEKPPVEQNVREMPSPILKTAVTEGDEGKSETAHLIHNRVASVEQRKESPNRFKTMPNDSMATKDKGPLDIPTTSTDQQPTSSDDDADAFKDAGNKIPMRQFAFSDADENELQKGPPADAVKSTGAETTRVQAPFQDSAKIIMADKPSIVQGLESNRPQPLTPSNFQTAVMDQIVDRASLRSIQGRSEIQIRLKPDFLGNVQMNIAADKEQLVVRIVTDQPVVKEIIETNLHQLKAELQGQGLTIDKFEVMVNPDADHQNNRDQFSQMFKNPDSRNGRRQQREQDPETMHQDNGNSNDEEHPDDEGINYFA